MANYNNYPKKQYAKKRYPKKQYAKKRYPKKQYTNSKKPSGDGFKTVVTVLVIFLLIGLIGSVFSRPSADKDTNETQTPTISVTDPTEATDPEEVTDPADATDPAPELISFNLVGTQYQAEKGMTFDTWLRSDYSVEASDFSINDDGFLSHMSYGEIYNESNANVQGTDVIVSGGVYNPA